MLQAITTKYLGPTNQKGSRISVNCAAMRLLVNWDHNLSVEDNHMEAAKTVWRKLEWDKNTKLIGGALPAVERGPDYCFVMVSK